jgi:serine/threonine protein kinase
MLALQADFEQNILVCRPSPHWWVKLADFGLSKRRTDDTAYRTQTGTQAYMAPEMLNFVSGVDPESSEYTNAVDMWAMGCIVHRLALGCVPFPPGPPLGRFCNDPSSLPLHELPLSPPGVKFIRDLLVPLPSARLTAQQALGHA